MEHRIDIVLHERSAMWHRLANTKSKSNSLEKQLVEVHLWPKIGPFLPQPCSPNAKHRRTTNEQTFVPTSPKIFLSQISITASATPSRCEDPSEPRQHFRARDLSLWTAYE